VDDPDAAAADAAGAFGDVVLDVAGGKQGTVAALEVPLIQAALDTALAVGQLPAYLGFPFT
jgi:hypothetical protein